MGGNLYIFRTKNFITDQTAYVLANARWESNFGSAMVEKNPKFKRYKNSSVLGNTEPGDGQKFIGRGYAMMTGRDVYTRMGSRLGYNFVNNTDLATDKAIAAKVLVIGMKEGRFTGVGLNDFINEQGTDYEEARRIINGEDQKDRIAGFSQNFEPALNNCN